MERRIILAAGHGGGDSGAVSRGTTEAAQCIDITNRVAEILRVDGRLHVVVVPHELGLVHTITWVNSHFKGLDSGLLLEIHKNSGGGRGVETWYPAGGNSGEISRKATVINNDLAAYTGLPNRGVKPDSSNRHGRLGILQDTQPWALLVECGFIDVDHFDNDLYARGLARGILAQWSMSSDRPDPKPAPSLALPTVNQNIWHYRVKELGTGKQLGAYKDKLNAWKKYKSVNGNATIVDRGGADLTPQFVAEFRPKPSNPAPEPVQNGNQEFDEVAKQPGFFAWLFGKFK